MEQVEVCNSWEEFDDNSKLLEEQLEKLKLEKSQQDLVQKEIQSPSSVPLPEEPPKMKVLKRNAPPQNNNAEVTHGVTVTTSSTNGVIEIQDESMRTQYVPQEPRISKILSRPKKNGSEDSLANNSNKAKNQPVKTLEQREQEYAEARRRIFGDTLET